MANEAYQQELSQLNRILTLQQTLEEKQHQLKAHEKELTAYYYAHSPNETPTILVVLTVIVGLYTIPSALYVLFSKEESSPVLPIAACVVALLLWFVIRHITLDRRLCRHMAKQKQRLRDIVEGKRKASKKKAALAQVYTRCPEISAEIERLTKQINEQCERLSIPEEHRDGKHLREIYRRMSAQEESTAFSVSLAMCEEQLRAKNNEHKSYSSSSITQSDYYKKAYDKYYRMYMGYPPASDTSTSDAIRDFEDAHMAAFVHDIGGGDI